MRVGDRGRPQLSLAALFRSRTCCGFSPYILYVEEVGHLSEECLGFSQSNRLDAVEAPFLYKQENI
ncbi:hypothetical protein [Pyrobaculum sp.]|uniref:hypothetical protein n=1 Tax=Pyrobaculum sp. TaxID=2004705 RepID=UPI003D0A763A